MKVVYRLEAQAEIHKAIEFYKSRADGLGHRFLSAIDEHIKSIASNPERFPKVAREIRHCVVRRFPFIIFFRIGQNEIRILAVAHASRHPDYWKRRE